LKKSGKIDELGSLKTLFVNHKDNERTLFFYYPSTDITTSILKLNNYNFLSLLPVDIFLLLIIFLGHLVPVLIYWKVHIWHNNSRVGKIIIKIYSFLYTLYYRMNVSLKFGLGMTDMEEQSDVKKMSEELPVLILDGWLIHRKADTW